MVKLMIIKTMSFQSVGCYTYHASHRAEVPEVICKVVSGHPPSPLTSGDFFECVTYTGVDTPSLQFFVRSFLFWLIRWGIVISVKFYEQDICSVTDFSSQRWGFIVYPILGLVSIWRLLVRELSSYKKRNVLDLILLWFAHFFAVIYADLFQKQQWWNT